jgi:hypothetical protein
MEDIINHPQHYTNGKYEVIEVIEDWRVCYHLGNVIKYIARHQYKEHPIEDLRKAEWYLKRLIDFQNKFTYEHLCQISKSRATDTFEEIMIDWALSADLIIVLKNIIERNFEKSLEVLSNYIIKLEENQTEQINE